MAVIPGKVSEKLTGHTQIRSALRNTQTYSSDLQGDADVRDYKQLPLEVDPPIHHLYRAALTPYFVKPAVEKHQAKFSETAKLFLNKYFSAEPSDLVSNLALPYVMENLGVLYNRSQDVAEWISWGPDVWTAESEVRDGKTLHNYIDRVYAQAINGGKQDIWNEIAHLEINGNHITEIEFKGIAGVMLAGGRDTVIKMITGITWYLAKNPEVLRELRNDRSFMQSAISEFLRFFTPLPAMARTKVPESSGQFLPEDRYVEVSFISGNFDSTAFDSPFEINLKRPKNAHLSFGFGPHTCLGLHLAEFEIRLFLEALLDSGIEMKVISEEITYHGDDFPGVPDKFNSLSIKKV